MGGLCKLEVPDIQGQEAGRRSVGMRANAECSTESSEPGVLPKVLSC